MLAVAAQVAQVLSLFKGLNGTSQNDKVSNFVLFMEEMIKRKGFTTKTQVEKVAAREFGIGTQNDVKEYTELAIVNVARELAHNLNKTVDERYQDIVDLYKSQVNLSHRTSQSILLQQYSTPAPIGFLAGVFCGVHEFNPSQKGFEPSAGNGLLTIAAKPSSFIVNEIDDTRHSNLVRQGALSKGRSAYDTITQVDAKATLYNRKFDAIITNPPFGKEDDKEDFDGYKINTTEHIMAIHALNAMRNDGKAAIIIGGHNKYDEYGRFTKGKQRIFFNYLYHFYNVVDIVNIDGSLYSRQGQSTSVRLILITGRKATPSGVAPLENKAANTPIKTFDDLFDRVMAHNTMGENEAELEALALKLKLQLLDDTLGMAYMPESKGKSLEVDIPDSMGYEMADAIAAMVAGIGNVDDYVTFKLKYRNVDEMHKALASEQVDAVALAIYNIEEKGQGVIIGDQTGIGKGRQAAAIIRYGAAQGMQPIFVTEKPNLFSDLYRDLKAIGSETLEPFIVNSKEAKTQVKDEEGKVVFEALEKGAQDKIIGSAKLPSSYQYVMLTYSQISGSEFDKAGKLIALSKKANFVNQIAQGNILILDEAHNASGDSNTGRVLQKIVAATKGVTFLSATFAKRPNNMPLYALKTAMKEANMTKDELVAAIEKGGVALQEVLSSQLVKAGQLIRRERNFEGIEVNYITLDDKAIEHKAIYDNITSVIRDIIKYQKEFVDKEVDKLDQTARREGGQVEKRAGTRAAGVNNSPYFSKAFQIVNQMLFAIKADAVADRAIHRLKQGKKPVIAFSSTMGSFLESMEDENGMTIAEGSFINADFATSLLKGLESVMRYSEINEKGETVKKKFDLSAFSLEAQEEYNRIAQKIRTISSGIVISPIDIIKQKLTKAGYTVAEVTGRKLEVEYIPLKAGEKAPEIRLKADSGEVKLGKYAKMFIPSSEAYTLIQNAAGEEGEFFIQLLADVDKMGSELVKRDLEKETSAYTGDEQSYTYDVALPTFHYFNGSSDWYMYEFNEKEKLFYGYTILNGDTQNAEWGYTSIDELFGNYGFGRNVELDLYFSQKPLTRLLKKFDGLGTLGDDRTTEKTTIELQRYKGLVKNRKKENTNDAFRKFNNNQVDVLLINQSGSTGASAHAIATKMVPASKVKQRVMILLQAELDINTEVQKRGRINRTGQLLKPIYDYVFSAIPAEKRLMMMLQKKLKSLDANTTSNQKNSEALLKSDDFLNKYGGKLAMEYCIENYDFNKAIDDPLHLLDETVVVDYETAASQVSGRVAVLSTVEQEAFYDEMIRRYNDYVDELKQTGEYDLEVEYLDLNAKQLDKKLIKGGKGGATAFGDNTYLEKTEINNLRKPLKLVELQNIIKSALGDSTPTEINAKYIADLEEFEGKRLAIDLDYIENKYRKLISEIKNDQSKLKDGESLEDAIENYEELIVEHKKQSTERTNNKIRTISSFFNYFTIGKPLQFPSDVQNDTGKNSYAVFCGFKIDYNANNPFAPSNIKANFAIASPLKYLSIPLSKNERINSIIGASRSFENQFTINSPQVYDEWSRQIKNNSGDRTIGYILTGNILQVFGAEEFRGAKLVQYTCTDGKMRKGALLPHTWMPVDNAGKATVKVQIPIYKARKAVKAMSEGANMISGNLSLIRYNGFYKLLVPRSRKSGGDIYLDESIIALTRDKNFNTVSAEMVAIIEDGNIEKVCRILQDYHSISVELFPWQLELCMNEIEENKATDEVAELPLTPPTHEDIIDDDIELLELEAEALKLKLMLLEL